MTAAALVAGLQAGLWHPLTVPAHVIALLGFGLMIGQQTRWQAALLAFAVGLAAGLIALASAVGETSASTVVLVGAAVAGLIAAVGQPLPAVLLVPLAMVIGIGIGLDSPPQAASIGAANAALAGTGSAAFAVVALIAAAVARLHHGWPRIGVRVVGSWVAASAILVVALRFAQ